MLQMLNLLLAQTAQEKNLTLLSVALLAGLFLILLLDATTKNVYVPKNQKLLGLIIFLFVAAIIAIILLINFYI